MEVDEAGHDVLAADVDDGGLGLGGVAALAAFALFASPAFALTALAACLLSNAFAALLTVVAAPALLAGLLAGLLAAFALRASAALSTPAAATASAARSAHGCDLIAFDDDVHWPARGRAGAVDDGAAAKDEPVIRPFAFIFAARGTGDRPAATALLRVGGRSD
jgi:hypothetical protein